MELHQVRYFLTLSRTLNFTRAAELCHVSQPTLTRAIHQLECELGGLLFSRERRNTHLTELGRLIEPHLMEVIAREGKVKQEAARFLTLEKAELAIGVMCTVAPIQFVSFLSRFKADNPGVEVKLLEGVPGRLCELLVAGELDVALMARPEGFAPPLNAQELYTERFVVACAAGHRFATRPNVHLHEMDGEIYLTRINCEFRDLLGELCHEHGAQLRRSFQSEREDWILTMVAAGMGVCFLPEYTACFPGVIGCPVVAPEVARSVCLVTVAGRRRSPPLAAFVKAVQRYTWPLAPI
jgi:LysR family hydrogen peroxide-inducible transcriptional activator